MINSIDKAYDIYFQMLDLVVAIKHYAEERIDIARNKKLPTAEDLNPNTRFVNNPAISLIENDKRLTDILKKKSLGWHRHPELIKHLYNKMTASGYYKDYMSKSENDYHDDVVLVEDFYINTVQDDEMVQSVVEEQSILWMDDIDFTLIMVIKSLEFCKPHFKDLSIQREYKNEDDQVFVMELFCKTVINLYVYQ